MAINLNLFSKLKQGLKRTSNNLAVGLGRVFLGKKVIDAQLLKDLETQLLTADVGVEVTREVVKNLTARVARSELADADALFVALRQLLQEILTPYSVSLPFFVDADAAGAASQLGQLGQSTQLPVPHPYVILLVGINGAGKTTTIGKLTKQLQARDKKVLLAAGDTFRAAAIEQLKVWGERNGVPVIAQQTGSDSAAVIYDALQAARARDVDVLIADTAGRLHTQDNLMDELKKVKRIMQKLDPTAPHEVLLVLDATIGQNAINQAKQFKETIGVTGLCLTKLDGTAKGGVIFAIAQQLKLPIRFIGIGEGIDDLKPFVAEDFVAALFAAPALSSLD
jgi:fused signal recognition particle receptor